MQNLFALGGLFGNCARRAGAGMARISVFTCFFAPLSIDGRRQTCHTDARIRRRQAPV